jgi:GNAT superfamily N-acetyltransferase
MPGWSSTVTDSEPGAVPISGATSGGAEPGPAYPPNYPQDLERDIVSDPETRYHLRPIRPDDSARLVAFHNHLAARSVYMRFFSFHPELSMDEVAHFTSVDYVDRLALVAEIGDQLIAVGRFDSQPGETEAEVAFVVADEYQHHGIGSVLLDELVRAARDRGIVAFRAETLAENRAMLDVFRHSGFPVTSSVDYGTVTLRFPIEMTEASRAAVAGREAQRHARAAPAGEPPQP